MIVPPTWGASRAACVHRLPPGDGARLRASFADRTGAAMVFANPRRLAERHSAGRAMSGDLGRDLRRVFVEELFARHHGEIYAYLLRMLRDPELAADLTQDAFVKAYRAYDTLEKPENARAWLYQIAHRVALDELRRRKIVRFLPVDRRIAGASPSAEHLAMDPGSRALSSERSPGSLSGSARRSSWPRSTT